MKKRLVSDMSYFASSPYNFTSFTAQGGEGDPFFSANDGDYLERKKFHVADCLDIPVVVQRKTIDEVMANLHGTSFSILRIPNSLEERIP